MSKIKHYFKTNAETWDQKVTHHVESDFYAVDAFRQGASSLNLRELKALGDVNGKSLLHLQCHFGQDTLSWSRMGAQCTGVDISEAAISKAKALNEELNLDAHFVCGNVLDTAQLTTQKFDIVFTSYGVIGWLPDLKAWAKMIAECLKPGGTFYIIEFHPIVWMWDYQKQPPKLKYPYSGKQVIYEEYTGTYAEKEAPMLSKEYTWNHGLGNVVTALIEAGLQIDYLNEYYESPYDVLPNLIKTDSGYTLKDKIYPLLFELKATKP